GLSDVLQSAVPPTIDFFKSLPTLPNDALVWGIYALVFEKEDQLPKLYIGSGTESKIGLRDRFRDYNRGDFTDLPSKCLKKGWTEKHRGLLCWSSIPPEIDIPLQRLRFLAIEATLAFAFSVVRNRPQKTDDVWSEIVPWPQATFPWAPLCTHSAFWEVPRGIDKINITSEELEERKAMQAQRKYCLTCHRN
ncbi:hypothetical protein B0H65DRAFT_578631, partial [Neurospora tetraspora]